MSVLANFPVVSQLTNITSDSRVSENAQYNCVPASIGACILWYEHKGQWDSTMNPDLLKDLAYGEAYRNDGTAAITYVPICQKLGYKLYAIDGNNAELVQKAHELIKANIPVIFTEPDPYSSNPGDSHVCVFFGEGNGALSALDPYIAKSITRTDGVWQSMLLFGQIWAIERLEETVRIDISQVTFFFEALNDHQWRCKQTGKVIQFAILDTYKGYGNSRLCGLSFLGLPVSDEISIAPGGIVKQHFERGVLCYDPVPHHIDNPPQWEAVYPMHLYSGVGQDPGVAKLQATVADLTAANNMQAQKITDLQQVQAVDPLANQALAVVRQIKTMVQPF